ncbi:MAG: type II toxin-antitoxin system VapC family toxin [Actinomycetota bacterium]|nr:type II toxin-antitoxin system VapC family toxin [Actinomycetota bacterium]
MTVVDTSVVVDYLLGGARAARVEPLFREAAPAAAPDLLVFEALSVLRRWAFARRIDEARAAAAVDDLGRIRLDVIPAIGLRHRAWELRHNLTAGDALFVALSEELREPLATLDGRLAAAARSHSRADVFLVHG